MVDLPGAFRAARRHHQAVPHREIRYRRHRPDRRWLWQEQAKEAGRTDGRDQPPRSGRQHGNKERGKVTFQNKYGMTEMKSRFTGLALAGLLVVAAALPGYAEDAAAPKAPAAPATSTPAAPQTEAPPPSVPRPSLAPKTAEPASPPAAAEPAPRRHRRYTHRHWRRYGYYRNAYWEPFPIYFPHFYRHRIRWSRIPWMLNF